jgi:hypothetical protein
MPRRQIGAAQASRASEFAEEMVLVDAATGQPFGATTPMPTAAAKSTTMTPSQVAVASTANGTLILAANANRLGATIQNNSPQTVYIGSAAAGLTIANGFAVPPGAAYNIDFPLYTGLIQGICASGSAAVTVVELT